jgi:hypothetical protein
MTKLFLVAGLALIGGCGAHCTEPEVRAANHGVVLDCNVDRLDSRREVCRVSTDDGDALTNFPREDYQ